ncbi:MAG: hypothetical protein ACOYIK_09220 [Coriobacteriales bacterium]|jgi:cell division protein FtsL
MASTARAYAPKRRYEEVPQTRIEVHPGQGRRADAAEYSKLMARFKVALVIIAVLTVVAVGRVWFTDATMDILNQTSAVETQIDEARVTGTSLEVQYYAATNPTKVKEYAADNLGMSEGTVATTTVDVRPTELTSSVTEVVDQVIADYNEVQALAAK